MILHGVVCLVASRRNSYLLLILIWSVNLLLLLLLLRLLRIEGMHLWLTQRWLLSEGRLGYLRWVSMELLLLLDLLHLLLLVLSGGLLLGVLGCHWILDNILLGWRLLEDRLLDLLLLILHLRICHTTLSILFLSPSFHLVISALHKLVSKIEKDSLSALFDDLAADALQWIAFNVD